MESTQQAFILRIAPDKDDRVREGLDCDQILIGWPLASELIDSTLDWVQFRKIMSETYFPAEPNLRRAGAAGGHLWRFIREMNLGDLVVVPHGPEFYVAKVVGSVVHDASRVEDETAFRRAVEWQNGKVPISRSIARAALQSRMKTQGTCAYATDLLPEILECLEVARRGERPTFETDLRHKLIDETLREIRSGRLDSFGFESLVAKLLEQNGAQNVRIVARSQDQGADILATITIAGFTSLLVAVQVKQHYRADSPTAKSAVEQLIRGIEAESADLGILVTCGTVSDEAAMLASEHFERQGVQITLVDGIQLASLIVDCGLAPPVV